MGQLAFKFGFWVNFEFWSFFCFLAIFVLSPFFWYHFCFWTILVLEPLWFLINFVFLLNFGFWSFLVIGQFWFGVNFCFWSILVVGQFYFWVSMGSPRNLDLEKSWASSFWTGLSNLNNMTPTHHNKHPEFKAISAWLGLGLSWVSQL